MKQLRKVESEPYKETVYLCNLCEGELREAQNDWGSFFVCDECGVDDFYHSKLNPIEAIKKQYHVTEYETT